MLIIKTLSRLIHVLASREVSAIPPCLLSPGLSWLSWPRMGSVVKLRGIFILPAGAALLVSCDFGSSVKEETSRREQILMTLSPELLLPAACHPSVSHPQNLPGAGVGGTPASSPWVSVVSPW